MTADSAIKPEDSVSTVWVNFVEDDKNDRPLAEGTQRRNQRKIR